MNIAQTTAKVLSHEERLDRLGNVAVNVGLQLKRGQELVMTAPVEALPLVRRITAHAYKAGASLVTTLFSDDEATLLRFQYGDDAGFDSASGWLYDGMAAAFRNGAARLAIAGDNPALLSGQDPEKVARANRARSHAYKPALELIVGFDINWSIVSYATEAWAKMVFPNETAPVATAMLWDAIFAASRVDGENPVAEWKQHNAALNARTTLLNAKRFHALHFRGPGTDLTVGLADDHSWEGGASTAKNGTICNANIPTEEVFTTPHRLRVDGEVKSTKPLSYQGTLIQDIAVKFEGGQIVQSTARTGADVLERVLSTDEGSRRLGEVALVPHSSPISKSNILFYNTLFDENAASHIALGQSYTKCMLNGAALTPAELAQKGANTSLIHIDWMIGSGQVDIDGLRADGGREALMRSGEWA